MYDVVWLYRVPFQKLNTPNNTNIHVPPFRLFHKKRLSCRRNHRLYCPTISVQSQGTGRNSNPIEEEIILTVAQLHTIPSNFILWNKAITSLGAIEIELSHHNNITYPPAVVVVVSIAIAKQETAVKRKQKFDIIFNIPILTTRSIGLPGHVQTKHSPPIEIDSNSVTYTPCQARTRTGIARLIHLDPCP